MGLGTKIPESERPPVEVLERFLALGPEVRKKVVLDLQVDCGCSHEVYDTGGVPAAIWGMHGPEVICDDNPVYVPLHPGVLTDAMVEQVVAKLDVGSYRGLVVVNLRGWGIICTWFDEG